MLQPITDNYLKAAHNAAATRTYRMAVRYGLSEADREDVEQELMLDMLERAHAFDCEKGSANTFTGMVSENRSIELVDRMIKDRMRLQFRAGESAANDAHIDGDSEMEYSDTCTPMWAEELDLFAECVAMCDIEIAMSYMSDEQAQLFELLALHQDMPNSQRASGMPVTSFYRKVNDLQMHLRMFGIRAAA